jgi:hypothetical protein
MKLLLLSIVFFFCALSLQAKTVDGYMITKSNDTVKCQINVNGLDLFDKVTITDSSGTKTKYRADELGINGFGFTYENNKYDYVLINNEDSHWSFMIRTVKGKRFNLFYSFEFVSTYRGASYRSDSYMIQDTDMRVVTVSGGIFNPLKKKIKKYLGSDTAMIDLLDHTVDKVTDVPKFVKAANEMQEH